MSERLVAMSQQCKNRGGSCNCVLRCKAIEAVDLKLQELLIAHRSIKHEQDRLESMRKMLQTAPATLADEFQFRPGVMPVMVFDDDGAIFGYETEEGDWIESNEWPFRESFVYPDDCRRHGIRVE